MFNKKLKLSIKLTKKDIFIQILLLISSYALILIFPYMFKYILDNLDKIVEKNTFIYMFAIITFALFSHIYIYFSGYMNQKYCNKITSQYMSAVIEKISNINIPDYEKMSKAKTLNLLNYDISAIYTWININISIPIYILQILLIAIILIKIDLTLALLSFALIPLYYLGNYLNKNKLENLAREEKTYADNCIEQIQDVVYKKTSIDLFNAWEFFFEKFNHVKDNWWDIVNKKHLYLFITKEFPKFISTITPFLILLVGANFVSENKFTLGTLIMFIQYVAILYQPLTELSNLKANVNSDIAAFERINEFLDYKNKEENYLTLFDKQKSILKIKNTEIVNSSNELLFKIDDFEISKKGLYILKGENGTGKTTLFNLISGVYSVEQIKGNNKYFTINNKMFGKISYLYNPQILFNGTVKENIILSKEEKNKDIKRMKEMLKLFKAKDEDYIIKTNPVNLSLGEQQKLFLIRVFLKDLDFILLDEPSANLDYESKLILRDFLNKEKKKKIIMLISHDEIYEEIADNIFKISDKKLI